MRLLYILFLLALWSNHTYSQVDKKIDSLELLLNLQKSDNTTKAEVLRQLSSIYRDKEARKSIQYAVQALNVSTKINDKKITYSYSFLGVAYGIAGNLDSSLWAFEQLAIVAERQRDYDMTSSSYNNIAITYNYMANYKASLASSFKCLEVSERNNLPKYWAYTTMAETYRQLRDFNMSLHYDSLAIDDAIEHHGSDNIKDLLMGNMAASLVKLNKLEKAKQILSKCIDFREKRNDKFYLSNHYEDMAEIYLMEKNYNDAFGFYYKSLILNKEVGNLNELASGYERLGTIDFLREKILTAKKYATQSLKLSDSLNLLNTQHSASELLWKIALYQRDLIASVYYDSIKSIFKDSLNFQEHSKAIAEIKTKYETDKKEKENELLRFAKVSQEAELSVQRYAIVMIGVTLFAVLVLLFVVFRSRQLFKKTNTLLKRKNDAIELQQAEIISQKELLSKQVEELRKTQSQLIQSEKMASLGQMTSGIAHEINNPLNFISGGVEGLKYSVGQLFQLARSQSKSDSTNIPELEQEVSGLINNISNGVHRANKIITSLRTFSSPHGSTFAAINIIDTIEMAVTMLNNKITSSSIEIIRSYSEPIQQIVGSASELSQVFMNIIDNAIQAMEGEVVRKLEIHAETLNENVIVTISDTGHGIPPGIYDKIMEPFFTTKEAGKGTGLGLSISYGIIEKHLGKLSFNSEEGKGTKFRIVFNVA